MLTGKIRAHWSDEGRRLCPLNVGIQAMAVEVIAVRYSCDWGCDQTVVCAEGCLAEGWFEVPAPPWRSHHSPRHACPDHAADAGRIHRIQWAGLVDRTHVVSAAEYEEAKVALRHAGHLLERLKLSGERADGG